MAPCWIIQNGGFGSHFMSPRCEAQAWGWVRGTRDASDAIYAEKAATTCVPKVKSWPAEFPATQRGSGEYSLYECVCVYFHVCLCTRRVRMCVERMIRLGAKFIAVHGLTDVCNRLLLFRLLSVSLPLFYYICDAPKTF